jgi:HEAT repeat protein
MLFSCDDPIMTEAALLSQLQIELTSGDDTRAEAAMLAIGAFGDAALSMLQPLLTHTDSDIRWWAACALGATGSDAALAPLIERCADTAIDVRMCAILALGQFGERAAAAVSTLIARMTHGNVFEGTLAADALAQIGRPATDELIRALREGEAPVRGRAARALARIADPKSIPALIAALDDDSPIVEHYANEVLPKLGVGSILLKL